MATDRGRRHGAAVLEGSGDRIASLLRSRSDRAGSARSPQPTWRRISRSRQVSDSIRANGSGTIPADRVRSGCRWPRGICRHRLRVVTEEKSSVSTTSTRTRKMKKKVQQNYPKGWNEERVRKLAEYY